MIEEIVRSLMGTIPVFMLGVLFIRRLEHVSRRLDRIERGLHPASDPEPIAIVERDEPTEPTDLPRATARTRKP